MQPIGSPPLSRSWLSCATTKSQGPLLERPWAARWVPSLPRQPPEPAAATSAIAAARRYIVGVLVMLDHVSWCARRGARLRTLPHWDGTPTAHVSRVDVTAVGVADGAGARSKR